MASGQDARRPVEWPPYEHQTGRNPRKLGSAHPRNAPYQAYRAADGYFAIAAGNNKL